MEKLICHKSLSNNFDVACNLLESIPVISAVVTHYLKEFVKPSELCVIILQMRKLKIDHILIFIMNSCLISKTNLKMGVFGTK